MASKETVKFINSELLRYGNNIYGDPIFRVVFSNDQVEKRKTFKEVWTGLYLINQFGKAVQQTERKFTGIKEVKKYPWIQGKWILERWAPGELAYHPDLETDKSGVYICVYTYQDKDQNYLPPILRVAEIIIYQLLNPRKKDEALSEDLVREQINEEKEVDKIELELAIQSDESATKDPKSKKEKMSFGYSKSFEDELDDEDERLDKENEYKEKI